MKAIILCAGYATRLYPLTIDKPKALLEIKGQTVLGNILKKVEEIPEINEAIIVSNNKFFKQFEEWQRNFSSKSRLKIKVLNDGTQSNDDRLGSIGDLVFAISTEKINENFLAIHGDNLFNFNLKEPFLYFKNKKTNVVGLYDVANYEKAKQLGNAKIDKNGKIINFIEKPANPETTLASTGIYFYLCETISLIEDYYSKNKSDASGNFLEFLFKKVNLYGYIFSHKYQYFDIGTLEALEQARRVFI